MAKSLDYIFPNPPAGLDPAALDRARVPESVAIIMDGNGRWAKKRALNRLRGHKAGIEAVRETIRCASDLGVRYLTIYSFSTENWKRPEDEVVGLMDLFAKTMLAEVDGLHAEGVRVRTIGDLSPLPAETREAFDAAWEKTRDNEGEMRVSNFLLWQIAYSEFVVTDVLWPDFDRYEFLRCLLAYQGRNRRFGGVA